MERIKTVTNHLQTATEPTMSKSFNNFPTFTELPKFGKFAGCAWGVWGEGDNLGTINLLTDEVVAKAAKEEIKKKGCFELVCGKECMIVKIPG
ncbi:hypothetical protein M422DRAFT_273787 [Sphaerobolus stellatus SS14]|uniref:Uncharacterized protein n=1 Tax=Sphaerobolus stellatus (strain SS14) TaxID=990650 RepID=A0A0C9TTT3_SPHS4|nr:hypothetical protein M422DRAFT_273787 [Sphaerobolus stellatus SS14]